MEWSMTGSYRQEVAARAQAAISRILASAVESPEIRREDRPRLLAKGYRVLGDALEQLALLPECPIDSTTARHTGPLRSLAFGKDTLAVASKTAEAYLVKLEAVRHDGATAQLRSLLTRLNQASAVNTAADPE